VKEFLSTLCESCIYPGKCICLLLHLCSFSCVDRFMFKIWAFCVEKRHLQDSELELAYLWYMLGGPTHCGLHGFQILN
jgi:hypothetical protein